MLTPALIALLSNAPNTTFATHDYQDSILVVQTVCAPICSSIARVYDKDGHVLREIPSPYPHAVFPEAELIYPDNDSTSTPDILWRDNTPLMLDDIEKKQEQEKTK